MKRLPAFGALSLWLVLGCGGNKPDLPPATGTPGVWENVTSPESVVTEYPGGSAPGPARNAVTDPSVMDTRRPPLSSTAADPALPSWPRTPSNPVEIGLKKRNTTL